MTILVIGASGKTGGRVVEKLTALNVPVRGVSRTTQPAFDWHNDETWEEAIRGATAAYITYAPDIALPGALEHVAKFISFAVSSGLTRLVLLSGRREDEAQRAEEVLINSGAEWTIVRSSWFMQNFSEGFFADEICQGKVHFPRIDVPEPFIDVDDIAEIVADALTDTRHIGSLYDVTGPRLLTFKEALAEISVALQKQIELVQVEIPQYLEALRELHVPEPYVKLLEILTTEVLDGRNSQVTDGVEQALQRRPQDFSAFVSAVAATGTWANARGDENLAV